MQRGEEGVLRLVRAGFRARMQRIPSRLHREMPVLHLFVAKQNGVRQLRSTQGNTMGDAMRRIRAGALLKRKRTPRLLADGCRCCILLLLLLCVQPHRLDRTEDGFERWNMRVGGGDLGVQVG